MREAQRLRDAARSVPPDARPTPRIDGTPAWASAPRPAPPSPEDFEIVVDPLAQAYAEHGAAKQKRDVRREHAALVEENTRLKSTIHEMIAAAQPPSIHVYDKAKEDRADAIACAQLSDAHVDEPVDLGSTHGLNEYSPEIAEQRFALYFKNLLKLTDIIARDSKVTTIYIGILGDLFSGWIHDELVSGTAMAPGDAARFAQGLIVSGIDFLLREGPYDLLIDALPGNHGRMTEKMSFNDPTGTSLETFMYHAVAGRYSSNPRVSFNVAAHATVYRKFFENFTIRLIHGWEVKFGGGVGGLSIPLNKFLYRANSNIRADLTLLGHFHQRLDGGSFLVNGSVIGHNAYAAAHGFAFEPAAQNFFAIQARSGGSRGITAPIWCTPDARKTKP